MASQFYWRSVAALLNAQTRSAVKLNCIFSLGEVALARSAEANYFPQQLPLLSFLACPLRALEVVHIDVLKGWLVGDDGDDALNPYVQGRIKSRLVHNLERNGF
jgi:hypothetical protein